MIQTETCGIKLIRAVGFVDNWQLLRKMRCGTSVRKITQTHGALKSDLEIFRKARVCTQLNGRLSLPQQSHWAHSADLLKSSKQTASRCSAAAKMCTGFPEAVGKERAHLLHDEPSPSSLSLAVFSALLGHFVLFPPQKAIPSCLERSCLCWGLP